MKTVSAEKKLIDKLIESSSLEECTEKNWWSKNYENKCICSYTVCVVLTVTALAISIGTGTYFAYSCWYFKKDVTRINFGTRAQWNYIQTTI